MHTRAELWLVIDVFRGDRCIWKSALVCEIVDDGGCVNQSFSLVYHFYVG